MYDLAMYLKNARNIMFDKIENCHDYVRPIGKINPITENDFDVLDALIRVSACEKFYDLCYKLSVARDFIKDKFNAQWSEEILKKILNEVNN
jgi:hypothetical protein